MDFTNEEKDRINVLYGTDFKGEINSKDIDLISRWERYKVENGLEYQAKRKEQDEILAKKIEIANEKAALTREILTAKRDAAKAKLERVKNGQEK